MKALVPVIGFAVALGSGACAKKEPTATPVASASASARGLDRLLPGELAEGRERAMGLAVPRDMRVERVFDDSVVAKGRVGADALATYVRKRVDVTTIEIGGTRTLFPRAHIKGQPDGRLVRIEVMRDLETTVLIVRDVTPPPVPSGLTEDERWRKAGVVPGKPFDPSAL
ncbi:MAG TPA: hypothetical protein VF881_05910 [Polyangiaceae bacterium]